jgi:recombination protein RecA
VKCKIVKNKVAPPFKVAEFDILYGKGISKSSELIDMGITLGIIKKSGSWFSYEGERLAQGKDNARKVFESNQELMDELEAKVRAMADKLVDNNNDEFELDEDDDIESFELETLSDEE